MRKLSILLVLIIGSLNLHASEREIEICKALDWKAYGNCMRDMCETGQGGRPISCDPSDGDFKVELFACIYDEMNLLVAAYNKKHPRKKINCSDLDWERDY